MRSLNLAYIFSKFEPEPKGYRYYENIQQRKFETLFDWAFCRNGRFSCSPSGSCSSFERTFYRQEVINATGSFERYELVNMLNEHLHSLNRENAISKHFQRPDSGQSFFDNSISDNERI